jgi:hypothetical protein
LSSTIIRPNPAPRQSTNVFTETAMKRVTHISSSPTMISSTHEDCEDATGRQTDSIARPPH